MQLAQSTDKLCFSFVRIAFQFFFSLTSNMWQLFEKLKVQVHILHDAWSSTSQAILAHYSSKTKLYQPGASRINFNRRSRKNVYIYVYICIYPPADRGWYQTWGDQRFARPWCMEQQRVECNTPPEYTSCALIRTLTHPRSLDIKRTVGESVYEHVSIKV
jgi:hypothetical protein